MEVRTVAVLSPGDMGHAVGRTFLANGLKVITSLEGRGDRTRRLSQAVGIRDVGGLEAVVSEADLVLSILVPAEAVGVARHVSAAMRSAGVSAVFADCNAVSPETTSIIGNTISDAGGLFVDGSIIGGPPGPKSTPRFYVSGQHAGVMSELDGLGISVRQMGNEVGRASAIKMCYAALTKGSSALHIALLVAAESLGVSGELRSELMYSQQETYKRMTASIPGLPSKASRWIGEMEEISSTFDSVGVTPFFHLGAAEVFRMMSRAPFADETAEAIDHGRTLDETIAVLVHLLHAMTTSSKT